MSRVSLYSLSERAEKLAEAAQLMENSPLFSDTKRPSAVYRWFEKVELMQETYNFDNQTTAAASRLDCDIAAEYACHRKNQDEEKPPSMESLQKLMTDNYGNISAADNVARTTLELKHRGDIAQYSMVETAPATAAQEAPSPPRRIDAHSLLISDSSPPGKMGGPPQ